MSGALVGSPCPPPTGVGARKNSMHSMYLAGVPTPTVHVAAGNPLCARRHPDLVGTAIVADRCASGVAAMEEIIARHGESSARKCRRRCGCCRAN